jgi:NAD(P)H-dependent FMN reductase
LRYKRTNGAILKLQKLRTRHYSILVQHPAYIIQHNASTMSPIAAPALLLLGSHRENSNGAGVAAWVTKVWDTRRSAREDPQGALEPTRDITKNLPADFDGPLTGSEVPKALKDSELYTSPAIRAWSKRVRESSAVVIVTPEYNGGYPGSLKNAIDHLYWEWKGKPIVLVAYGGRGGISSSESLKAVLGVVNAKVVDVVNIQVPFPLLAGTERVTTSAEFLKDYEEKLSTAIDATFSDIDSGVDVVAIPPAN